MGGTKLGAKLHKLFDYSVNGAAFLSAITLGFTTLLVCADIGMRYFFNKPITGVLESTEYGLLFFTLLAATWLLRRMRHVKMDLILSKLRPGAQTWVNGVTSMLCAIVCGIVTYYGVIIVIERYKTAHHLTTTLAPLSYPLMVIIPLCFFLLFIQFILSTIDYLSESKATKDIKQDGHVK
jgi:C4-dicarboxylate transporter DctQ subunit